MTTTTSLALQSLLLTAVNRSGLSRSVSRITGLSGSARALAVAATANRLRTRPVLFVLPTDAALDDAVDDVRFLLRSLEGLADAVTERVVLPFPSLQVDPVSRAGAALQGDVGSRAGAACAGRRASCASWWHRRRRCCRGWRRPRRSAACRPRSGPATTARPMTCITMLAEGGYERQDPVDEHGEFCLRGGILDIFAAGDEMPVRIEFVGDTVESIRRFDPVHAAIGRNPRPVRDRPGPRLLARDGVGRGGAQPPL